VSRVINAQGNVSKVTEGRVLQAIVELGYKPNLVARNLVQGSANAVGVVIGDDPGATFANPYFSDVLKGIGEVTADAGYHLLVLSSNDPEVYQSFLSGGLVDGVIVMNLRLPPVDQFLTAGPRIPLVMTFQGPQSNVSVVDVDNVKGAYLATSHLLSLGHRRVAMISGPEHLALSRNRHEGYKQALEEYGVRYNPALVGYGSFTEGEGFRLAGELLARDPSITAYFVAADVMAVGAIRAISRADRRIPEDVSVVGFDDISMARYLQPPLTTVRQRSEEKGSTACRILLSLLQDDSAAPRTVLIDPELVIRDSTAPLSNRGRQAE
jgi:DNA-binding LacI/PurR family transcriptional regulator